MSHKPLIAALAQCNPNQPLEPGDPRFVDLDDVRGQPLRTFLLSLLEAADLNNRYAKAAVVGHRGSGKSTELNQAQAELERNYETLWASVNENLDPREIAFSDVIRLIMLMVDDRFGHASNQYPAVAAAFESVAGWFREVTRSFTEQIDNAKELGMRSRIGGVTAVEAAFEAGVVAKGGLKARTDLGELSAAISIVRRSEGKERIEIREKLERYNNQLVENLNLLLRAVTAACCPGKKLVIILDNVDKYEPEVVNQAFLRNADLLHAVDSHLIFTIQSSLLHHPVEDAVDQSFRKFELPMLPVFLRHTRNLDEAVVARIREAVYKRVPPELFTGVAEVDQLIRASGGCWRDLLRLLEEALLRADASIGPAEVKAAIQQVAQTYRRLLRSPEDLQALARAHVHHTVLSDDVTRYLLHHLCLLSYNGEGWYDFHPLLDGYKPVMDAVEAERRVASQLT